MKPHIEITAPPSVTKRVNNMVRQQHAIADELGLPRYGFPSARLQDVQEIAEWAARMAANFNADAWTLHYANGTVCARFHGQRVSA